MRGKPVAGIALAAALAMGLGGCSAGAKASGAAAKAHPAARTRKSPPPTKTVAEAAPAHVYYRDQVIILMYHGIGPQAHGDIITLAAFAGEMKALQSAGFSFVSLAQVAAFLHGGVLPPNAVCLTFDDGLESVYTYAFPVLKTDRIPFATFLIAGRVNNFTGDLSWAQVKAMVHSGLLTVGSHTFESHGAVASGKGTTGAALTTHIYDLSTGQTESDAHYRARVEGDLVRARSILQLETGQTVKWFAYPFGAYDPAVEQMLQQAGYQDAVTTWGWGTTVHARPLALPRENAGTPKNTPSTIADMVLYVAHLTSKDPTYQTPQEVVPNWR